jgi:glycosyltransferase involved in cell wall biosynthesis
VEGGVASVVFNLLEYFNGSPSNIRVILLSNHDKQQLKRHFRCAEVIHINISHKKTLYRRCKLIRKYINKDDIIISNDGGLELDTIRLMNLKNPVTYIMHGDFDYYYKCIEKNIDIINSIITVSEYINRQIKDSYPLFNGVIETIYFPIPQVPNQPNTAILKNHDTIKVIYTGALIERKGIHLFEKIVENLKELKVNFQFTIIGTGPLIEKVKTLVTHNKEVNYLGQKSNEEILKLLPSYDILILPSSAEGLPVSIVEAMKAGLAIVASNIKSGIPELVQDGITGYKAELNNCRAFAIAIHKLQSDINHLEDLKIKAKQLANRMFDPCTQTNQYFAFFNGTPKNRLRRRASVIELLLAYLPDKYRTYFQNLFL